MIIGKAFFPSFFVIICFYVFLFSSLLRAEEDPASFVHINEFIPNPVGDDSKLEFIELYNNSDQSVDISEWIVDTGGSAHFTIASGIVMSAGGYLTFFSADKNISLTNSGDHIKLIRADATIQDDITYSSSKEGYSYNRNGVGMYQESSIPTPNTLNTFPATPTPVSPTPTVVSTASPVPIITITPTSTLYSSQIHISEFLPNPAGDDGELEFIELHNESSDAVDISGWIVDTGPTSIFMFPPGTILAPGEFRAFFSASFDISLSNSGDHIKFSTPDAVVRDDIVYTASKEGYSYNRADSGSYDESFSPTPNANNSITSPPTPTPKITTSTAENSEVVYEFSSHIVLNEVMPNPKGADEVGEFIEIKNLDTKSINMFGWSLDDATKGGAYHFPIDFILGPKRIVVLYGEKTKIALNNTTDTVKLIDPNGDSISTMSYRLPVVEGHSFNRDPAGIFAWSEVVTPGYENIIRVQIKNSAEPSNIPVKKIQKEKVPQNVRGASIRVPTVLGARAEKLPWQESVSRTVMIPGTQLDAGGGKKHLFILFGTTLAFLQLLSGISRKEAIWRRL